MSITREKKTINKQIRRHCQAWTLKFLAFPRLVGPGGGWGWRGRGGGRSRGGTGGSGGGGAVAMDTVHADRTMAQPATQHGPQLQRRPQLHL